MAVTFDDGYKSVLAEAAPVLRKLGMPATVFVPTKWIGMHNTWDDAGPCELSIMDRQDLIALEEGGIAVESHGHAHIDLSTASAEAIKDDLLTATARLEDILGRAPRYLAYPYGRSSATARAVAESCGLRAAFGIDAPHGGRFAFERVQITPLDGPRLFALKTSGRYMAWRHSKLVSSGYALVRPVARRVLGRARS